METYAVEIDSVSKRFGGIHALNNVSLKVRPGEIHSIVGENGAGKSTLMKVLSGAVVKDTGNIAIFGKETDIGDTVTSKELGIGIIYQEFSLAPDLSVAENIYLGNLNGGKKRLVVPFADLFRKSKGILDRLGFKIDPHRLVRTLPVALQQVVEIAKALSQDARILILDEPTAVLTDSESEKLFGILESLRKEGVSIIYISHRLEEVLRLSDRISAMKDGELVSTKDVGELDKAKIITEMTGREFATLFPKREKINIGKELLRAENLSANNGIHNVNLTLHRGEILGLSGLIGSGRTEFARAVFGLDKITEGELFVNGEKVSVKNIKDAKRLKIGLIPEDRKHQGLALRMSILENITMAKVKGVIKKFVLINHKKEEEIGSQYVKELRIKCGSVHHAAGSLSGGNQQKVVIAKWLNTASEILILDEPTRGVDVGAKVEIYHVINKLADQGFGVILISSELSEVIGMADRVAVFTEGTVSGDLRGKDISEKAIMHLAFPVSNQEAVAS
ncbi:Ribose import ATP-binding protein RbsA [Paraburkholderia ultramafica]|uniref:Ribose import ATP-binding protein RbsA n=1 Tax=Paraburkholderia ultramafica TaxID=1544867 RepID=A0A6S7AVJ7_9BURK|nr:sugar ABC transporter ATP-binding protein [Paraburkholderia ultramafica]CAB3779169.1 Ribose import ATP-binding protein RbsA [Paraburkholderia ultramafica]